MLLAPFEKGFVDQLYDIPIKACKLPDSELEIGKKEQKVFDVAYKVVPDGMVEETFTTLLGHCTILKWNFG